MIWIHRAAPLNLRFLISTYNTGTEKRLQIALVSSLQSLLIVGRGSYSLSRTSDPILTVNTQIAGTTR